MSCDNEGSVTAVSVRGVGKMYRLYTSHGDRVKEALLPFRRHYHQPFWALDDISFDVPKGQTLGILGRNGSGKSTLLQLIAGVLSPTQGSVHVDGRLSALLELGAGFNPEFTGRENVLMHGALLGIGREEMNSKLPMIEQFSGIGEFFDRPVKIYSSGMFVRVGFAAAISVDPKVLIIDEAISVGDVLFQQKCFQHFKDLQNNGTTILFVSHSQDAVASVCDAVILLEQGRIVARGTPAEVIPLYHELLFTGEIASGEAPTDDRAGQQLTAAPNVLDNTASLEERSNLSAFPDPVAAFLAAPVDGDQCQQHLNYNSSEHRFGDGRATIVDYGVFTRNGMNTFEVYHGEDIELVLKVRANAPIENPMIGYSIKRVDGVTLAGTNTRHMNIDLPPFKGPGNIHVFRFKVEMRLSPTDIFIEFGVAEKELDRDIPADIRKNIVHMKVLTDAQFEGIVGMTTSFECL